ncbi:MAG: hypothetical protein M3021_01210 [Actinomycetota bacterium]|uniref:hypothetical protein n=1 Tax=Paenarthrobacter sp. PH39-S1 TaxID=3046204 RepID=UPI0024B8D12E|nr:hypothetical protein [Paenarthrobacter sp. PH39-S1]MDJ0356387.1 hypothetical protein [Paenarthrobacter sp. PH39-S1]MDQ6739013.1 hypothetical protein [Actinomycetota bacterium]
MTDSIIILTEEPLGDIDAENITRLYENDDDVELLVLVPADTKRNLLVDVVDQLTMLDLPGALRELREKAPDQAAVRAEAAHTLEISLTTLRNAGTKVTGAVAEGNAVASLVAKVNETQARQAVVVTRPHALADTFRRDWASQAQHKLGLPVLHLYAGSGFIGDS